MKSKKSSKSSGSKKSLKKRVLTETITIEVNSINVEVPLGSYDGDEKNPSDDATLAEFEDFVAENAKILCDKSTAPSPTHSIASCASFNSNWARERELENTNESLQEKIKDTEERLQSLRIQYDSLSQSHRVLRENHIQLQEETDKLKIDFQILTECASVLR